MKTLAGFLLFTLLIASCKKNWVDSNNNVLDDNCIILSQNANWVTTEFRTNYTIQFPNNYSVAKQQGFEGMVYDVKSDDNSVHFHYISCPSMECYGFSGLPASLPDFITSEDSGNSIKLDRKATFCKGNVLTAVLYFNNASQSNAKLYWLDNGGYKQALEVSYDQSRLREVIDIIRTITKK
jgi:hypothetical protein